MSAAELTIFFAQHLIVPYTEIEGIHATKRESFAVAGDWLRPVHRLLVCLLRRRQRSAPLAQATCGKASD